MRLDILNQVATDIMFINTGNGYTNKLGSVYRGYIPITVTGDFDRACIFLGQERTTDLNSDGSPAEYETDLFIVLQLSGVEGEGALTRAVETWITDIKNWVKSGIKPVSGITTNKWLTLNTFNNGTGGEVQWGSVHIKETSPYMDVTNTVQNAEIIFTINVAYNQ